MSFATVDEIRAQFPAMRRIEGATSVAYLDGPGGTQVPQAVADAMSDYLLHHNANTHWNYPTSHETDAMLLTARDDFAAFFNGAAAEVSFGSNMTTITFHVARALARSWQAGDEVIVTEIDHHGNVAPWQAIARDFGIVLKTLPLNTHNFQLDLDALAGMITPRTRLLAINAASNLLGTLSDVTAAGRIAHAQGVLVYVDGVHYAPHFLPDVQAMDCDFFVCSPYKFYGPHLGVLWARESLLNALDVPKLAPAPEQGPERLETGTQNHEGIVAAAAAVRWIASLAGMPGAPLRERLRASYQELHRREGELFARLWHGLHSIPAVTCVGVPPGEARTATVSFSLKGHSAASVAMRLAEAGCYVSDGDFYAVTIAERLGAGADGYVRIGAACYTTAGEIDRVVAAVRAMAP